MSNTFIILSFIDKWYLCKDECQINNLRSKLCNTLISLHETCRLVDLTFVCAIM